MNKAEQHFIVPNELAQWFGAIFEVCGSLYFSRTLNGVGQKGTKFAWPTITLGHTNLADLETIKNLLQAPELKIKSSKRSQTFTLRFTRQRAVPLAMAIKSYAPSRRPIMSYIEWWNDAQTSQEKYIAAEEYLKVVNKILPVPIAIYELLTGKPAWLAGLLDIKASISSYQSITRRNHKEHTRNRKALAIYTKQHNLLLALKQQFGGSTSFGETSSWKVDANDARDVLAFAGPYLKLLDTSFFDSEPENFS